MTNLKGSEIKKSDCVNKLNMKKIIILSVLTTLILSCGKEDGQPETPIGQGKTYGQVFYASMEAQTTPNTGELQAHKAESHPEDRRRYYYAYGPAPVYTCGNPEKSQQGRTGFHCRQNTQGRNGRKCFVLIHNS